MEWNKEALKSLTILSLSVFLSISISRLLFNISIIEGWVIGILFATFITVFVVYLKSDSIGEQLWACKMERKIQSPIVAILRENQCENNIQDRHPYTSFLSADWEAAIRRLNLATEIISIDQLSDKYSVVINPYGELYPERDPIKLDSFRKIKDYIAKGGIFVCAGGAAFFYGWDARNSNRVTFSKQVQGLAPHQGNIFTPIFFYPPVYSLVDILINEHFGVNIIGDIPAPQGAAPNWQPIFQTHSANSDIRYVGNISQVGGTSDCWIFRAAVPETRCCIPFLRSNVPNFGEVFPIAGIPYERGLLILCGMNLSSGATVARNLNLDQTEFEKICSTIANLLDAYRRRVVSYNWKTGRNF